MIRRLTSQPPDLPGYTFIKVLGSGGFSDVFLYEQELPRRRVAVKVLLTEELSGANRTAFVAEANLMARLSAHPYIVTIYHAGVAGDDRPYFVMEYCPGASLAERYKHETFDIADALRTGVRLSSAVATAHAGGILHRDIKPGNVLTNDFGWPALTDFGISSAVEDEILPVHTGTLADALADTGTGSTGGQSVGMSVPWSPPEMFEDQPQPDVRSDVFSLAATLYTIIVGHTPFEVRGRSNGTLDLIGRIERGAVTPIARDDVPRSLAAVLAKGMATDRARRFATAVDFARALQRVELELGYSPTTIDVPNLLVEAPERDGGSDDSDKTRARSVSRIDAQPPVTVPHANAPRPSSDVGAAETVARGARSIDAQPAAAKRLAEPAAEHTVVRPRPATADPPVEKPAAVDRKTLPKAEPPSRTNRVVILVGSVAAVLVAVAVVSGLVISGGATPPVTSPNPSGDAGGGSAVIGGIPTPVLDAVTPDGGALVFTVTNPQPENGDSFVWKRSNRTEGEPLRQSDDGRLIIEPYAEGQEVCIEAAVLRAGSTSANPLETCFPQ